MEVQEKLVLKDLLAIQVHRELQVTQDLKVQLVMMEEQDHVALAQLVTLDLKVQPEIQVLKVQLVTLEEQVKPDLRDQLAIQVRRELQEIPDLKVQLVTLEEQVKPDLRDQLATWEQLEIQDHKGQLVILEKQDLRDQLATWAQQVILDLSALQVHLLQVLLRL
jgi:hypothetical protein